MSELHDDRARRRGNDQHGASDAAPVERRGRSVSSLAALLVDPSEVVAADAAATLRSLGPEAAEASGALAACLTTGTERWHRPAVQKEAIKALAAIGAPAAPAAVPRLLEHLRDRESTHAAAAAAALRILAPDALGAELDALVNALGAGTRDGRIESARHLDRLVTPVDAPRLRAALPVLIEWIDSSPLRDEEFDLAHGLLRRMGAEAVDALPVLTRHAQHPWWRLASSALETLAQLGPVHPAVTTTMIQCVRHFSPRSRLIAADYLAGLGGDSREARAALPLLRESLADAVPSVREAANRALAEIDGSGLSPGALAKKAHRPSWRSRERIAREGLHQIARTGGGHGNHLMKLAPDAGRRRWPLAVALPVLGLVGFAAIAGGLRAGTWLSVHVVGGAATAALGVAGAGVAAIAWLGAVIGLATATRGLVDLGDRAEAMLHRWLPSRPSPEQLLEDLRPFRLEPYRSAIGAIDSVRRDPGAPADRAEQLASSDWLQQWVGYHGLAALGREAAPALLAAPIDREHLAWDWKLRLLAPIAREVAARQGAEDRGGGAGERRPRVCPSCWLRATPTEIERPPGVLGLPRRPVELLACRGCHRLEGFVRPPRGVTAVYDRARFEGAGGPGPLEERGALLLDARARDGLFDFDRVRLVDPTAAEVEALAIRVGNDTDPVRRDRRGELTCELAPGLVLPPNALAILERTFGRVERTG